MLTKTLIAAGTATLTLLSSVVAANPPRGLASTTIAIRCTLPASPATFETRLSGIEFAGDRRRIPDIGLDATCTEAFNELAKSGFTIVHSSSSSAGPVTDSDDFILWQRNSGGAIP